MKEHYSKGGRVGEGYPHTPLLPLILVRAMQLTSDLRADILTNADGSFTVSHTCTSHNVVDFSQHVIVVVVFYGVFFIFINIFNINYLCYFLSCYYVKTSTSGRD